MARPVWSWADVKEPKARKPKQEVAPAPPPPPPKPEPIRSPSGILVAFEYLHHATQAKITIETGLMNVAKAALINMGFTDDDVMLIAARRVQL